MKPNRAALIELMHKHRLKSKDVANMLNVKPTTVNVWRCAIGIDISNLKLELLEYKTQKYKA